MTGFQTEEHIYKCSECSCGFTHAVDEPAICKCPSCRKDGDTEKQGRTCCV